MGARRSPQMTWQTQRVLLVMLGAPAEDHYGLELAREAELKSGTIYPILARLEAAGWISGSWEDIDPQLEGRRPRRYYRLQAPGITAAESVRDGLIRVLGANTVPSGLVFPWGLVAP